MESLVSLSWCIRQGTRGEGDGDADYLPPADQYKVIYDLSIGAIFNDPERPITQISRSRQYLTLNISVTVKDTDIFTMKDE